jgi:hypothetical protein
MTNTALNTTTPLDHLSESQMADIASSLNAIEPGAGVQEHILPGMVGQVQISGGFEFFLLACLLCIGVAFSAPYCRERARHIWRVFRKIDPANSIQKS